MRDFIPFNKPYFSGNETLYIQEAVASGQISGDGMFTKKCHKFFEEKYGFKKVLLTTSCSSALEMCALLIDAKADDEIIIPSYTFVSTANAFVLRGAKIIFADSEKDAPNIDVSQIESLITKKTKAIVCVHYAGMACDMEALVRLCEKYNIYLIEDAAHAIDSFYKEKPLGTYGQLATFSFHETKNIISGEGGMLVINDDKFIERAEIIREKGTNRSKFFRGEIDKYEWIDIGSSFLPGEIIAAFLFAQLENIENIQAKRKTIWNTYYHLLKPLEDKGFIALPRLPPYSSNNGHMFFIVCNTPEERDSLISSLKVQKIKAVFHYLSLHKSPFYYARHDGRTLVNCDNFSACLLRLPFYYELNATEIEHICHTITNHYALTLNA
jgi:dTDP-4-amino-4,6-dideoxygalactose transaminase